jgi:hypothetical protein
MYFGIAGLAYVSENALEIRLFAGSVDTALGGGLFLDLIPAHQDRPLIVDRSVQAERHSS